MLFKCIAGLHEVDRDIQSWRTTVFYKNEKNRTGDMPCPIQTFLFYDLKSSVTCESLLSSSVGVGHMFHE